MNCSALETTSSTDKGWREKNGVIYLSVTSDGTTGPEWIERLKKKYFRVSDDAKSVLLSSDFKPTSGVNMEIAILKSSLFMNAFSSEDPTTRRIRAEADKRKLTKPNAEVACLIREEFSDEDLEPLGLGQIVTMHEPIKGDLGIPFLLSTGLGDCYRQLDAICDGPGDVWFGQYSFAFVAASS